ncbi:MAG: aminoacyl-tRNA hydrolase [Tenericutes bacterium]|nr:aminoacyl-tRNA hydrolase [Mycoplasmatota bacterium]
MKLIVGLGNPGKKYINTKHNIGFMSLSEYANTNNIKYKKSIKFISEIAKTNEAIFIKPKTFMNNSGLAIRKVMEYYSIEPKDLLVIFDDLNLPFLKVRLRPSGSAGGHNGIKSIIAHLGTQDFNRLRIGIGRDSNKEMKIDVLSSFSKSESKALADLMISTANIIDDFIEGKTFENIMSKYN